MLDFQCWFCGEGIDRADTGAIIITVENLWLWEADSPSIDASVQSVYAHSNCAKDKMQGATMDLDPNLFAANDDFT